MKSINTFAICNLTILVSLAVYSIAFADAGVPPNTAGLAMYLPALVGLIGLGGAALRAWTPTTGFFHTKWGHVVIGLIGAVLGAAGSQIQQTGLNKSMLIGAVVGAVSSFVGALKPTGITS